MYDFANVSIPPLMAKNKRDKRGYPIPYIVFRDSKGKPQFTVNDHKLVTRCLNHNRCGICGNKLGDLIYFVGGPASAFHPNGAYVDPPMHKECATYALQVCPYIAFRKYTGAKAKYEHDDDDGKRYVVEDPTMMPGKPKMFVLKGTHGFVNMATGPRESPRLVPTDAEEIEFWLDGEQLDQREDGPHIGFIEQQIEEALGLTDSYVGASLGGPVQTSVSALATLATERR
jgi:hypothetical protein